MATYLPRVTDYIPRIQPFVPDLNFYQNVLSQKEAKYEQGSKQINSIYGTLLNSEMIREPDIEKRDQFFTNIHREIDRMSGVDLSLEENVDSAYRVFQPLLDDRSIMNDMVKTKKLRTQQEKGRNYRNCVDEEKCGGTGWDVGDRALDYWAKDFAESDDQEALATEDPFYTPYINTSLKAMKLFKEQGFDVSQVSHDPSGAYLVTSKNGTQLTLPLFHFGIAAIGGDQKAMDMYRTQAFVDRKDYIETHKNDHGGDLLKVEMDYITQQQAEVKKWNDLVLKEAGGVKDQLTAKQELLKDKYKNGIDPKLQPDVINNVETLLEELGVVTRSKDIHDETAKYADKLDTQDIGVLRRDIDFAKSRTLMSKDMHSAAELYAMTHSEQKMEADPYYKMDREHKYDVDLKQMQQGWDVEAATVKFERDMLLKGKTVRKDAFNPTVVSSATTSLPYKEPLYESNAAVVASQKNELFRTQQQAIDVLKGELKAKMASKNPKEAKYGAETWNRVFGPQAMAGKTTKSKGYVDNAAADSDYYTSTWHPDYIGNVYSRAIELVKGDRSLLESTNVTKFDENVDRAEVYRKSNRILRSEENKNYHDITEHIRANKLGDYADDAPLLMDAADNYNPGNFQAAYIKKYAGDGRDLEELREDAVDAYESLSKDIVKLYSSNDIPTIRPFTKSAFNQPGGGAIGTDFNLTYHEDPLTADVKTLVAHQSIETDISHPESIAMYGSLKDQDAESVNDLENSASARTLIDLYNYEFNTGDYKITDNTRPKATITHNTIVMGNSEYEAVTHTFNPQWIKKLQGTSDKADIAMGLWDDETGKYNNSVTVVYRKDIAGNVLHEMTQTTPESILVAHGGYEMNTYADKGAGFSLRLNDDNNVIGSLDVTEIDETTGDYIQHTAAILPMKMTDLPVYIGRMKAEAKKLQEYNILVHEQFVRQSKNKKSVVQIQQEVLKAHPEYLSLIQ